MKPGHGPVLLDGAGIAHSSLPLSVKRVSGAIESALVRIAWGVCWIRIGLEYTGEALGGPIAQAE